MRALRPVEFAVALVVAGAVGFALAKVNPRGRAPVVANADSGAAIVDASDAGTDAPLDVEQVEVEPVDAFAGFTVDDDEGPEPPDPKSTDIEELIKLIPIDERNEENLAIARRWLGPGSNHTNQGNPSIGTHAISRAQCRAGLKGTVLQTPAQYEVCGRKWEVPIHTGEPRKASVCIDQFEYPNRPCVLPFVFSHSVMARRLCALAGKRLCTQEEWNTACEADPNGGAPRKYAYGDELNLEICHTGRTKAASCDVDRALWKSCPTETVPTGSFPQCRSRLGVFDQHGNVAEAMTRMEGKTNYVQLKGSAFFYDGAMYADHCRFDPRWHVDPAEESWHTNYHLGFRCCRDVVPLEARGTADAHAPEVSVPGWNPRDNGAETAVDDDDPYAN